MYIVDPSQQIELIREMTQIRKDMENWMVYYHHPYTNQMWKSFFPKATGKDRGPKLLRHEPLQDDLREYLMVCLKEDVPENAIGAGIEQSARMEKWPEIIQALEKDYTHYVRSQLKLFLKHMKVEKFRENARELNLDLSEFSLSEKELKNLSWRSKKLKLKRIFR
ncbi:MAG: hypothetical protein WEA56_08055 [Balneolaceae bacterium]